MGGKGETETELELERIREGESREWWSGRWVGRESLMKSHSDGGHTVKSLPILFVQIPQTVPHSLPPSPGYLSLSLCPWRTRPSTHFVCIPPSFTQQQQHDHLHSSVLPYLCVRLVVLTVVSAGVRAVGGVCCCSRAVGVGAWTLGHHRSNSVVVHSRAGLSRLCLTPHWPCRNTQHTHSLRPGFEHSMGFMGRQQLLSSLTKDKK